MGPPRAQRRGGMSLLVRNLRFESSPDRVWEVFEKFGSIKDVYLPLDYITKRPRGFGFVEFFNERDAEEALREMDNSEIDGSTVEVTMAQRGRSDPDQMRQRDRQHGVPRGHDKRYRRRSPSPSFRRRRSASSGAPHPQDRHYRHRYARSPNSTNVYDGKSSHRRSRSPSRETESVPRRLKNSKEHRFYRRTRDRSFSRASDQ